MNNFGTKIRKIRKQKKLTLEQLSKKCGIDRTYISKIESGKIRNPYIPTLEKIANGLCVDVEILYPFTSASSSRGEGIDQRKIFTEDLLNEDVAYIMACLQELSKKDKDAFKKIVKVIDDLLVCFKSDD
ncbi:MAG: helix-turn-helix transcriptional regulator [Deltaproteobacteria bacterium]|nr:helix-turn-helix transcriptional regulator [Deltaproteobacteria bacterium]